MSIDASFARGNYPERIPTNNKIELEDGDYEVHIHDSWLRYVDVDGEWVKDPKKDRGLVSGQRIKFTITLDGTTPVIALAYDIRVKVSKNSMYSKFIEKMTGVADRDAQLKVEPKKLNGKAALATIKCEEKYRQDNHDPYPWSKIIELRPRQTEIKRPSPVHAVTPVAQNDDNDYVPFPDDSDYERR